MKEVTPQKYHYIIYQAPPEVVPAKRSKMFLEMFIMILATTGLLSLLISFGPNFLYYLKSPTYSVFARQDLANKNNVYQPRYDSLLPLEPRLVIPSIGVDTIIYESSYDDVEDALKKGVWRTPDSGMPSKRNEPVILAAHRFGYLAWTRQYRHENSFFNLPKLKEGDLVEIIWHQRKYTYAIYGESKGNEIIDSSADLILYTCQMLESDIRIFRYAKLLEI